MPYNAATLKDVAALAGVSVSTASRALAHSSRISEKTRDRVSKAAASLNYRPNIQARGLRNQKSNIIGLAIPSLVNPYFASMAAAIQDQATSYGQSTLIVTSNELELETAVYSLAQMRVDGMIVVPDLAAKNLLTSMVDAGTPIVLIDRDIPGSDFPCFASDPVSGIEAALRDLKSHGHSKIGYLSGPAATTTGAQRLNAFTSICDTLDISCDYVFRGGFEVELGRTGAEELTKRGVTALIAGDSMMTLGALDYCFQHEIHIGDELAFVGFDDLVYMRVQPVPISIIDQNVQDMGRRAHAGLLALLNGEDPPDDNRISPTTYIPRASTQCPPKTH
ncbi:LacI family DNA-binding transcriptional regulator [Staphylococcus chromogenes]|nr:LacI family DNA-binding transcriptional regulator [Staphylococcus chromogenes]